MEDTTEEGRATQAALAAAIAGMLTKVTLSGSAIQENRCSGGVSYRLPGLTHNRSTP
jgi:hypothetical protein